jgi:8-oxo-dGTP pyrophosphatase MutT (NUDIX family)
VTFDAVLRLLETSLANPLPGAQAQDRLAPLPRRQWPREFDQTRIRPAAGLLLVFPRGGDAHIVLTVRAETLERHGGQVSLPGGVIEPGESFAQAALREAQEEVGLPSDRVRVLGALTPLDIPVSGFRLHPVVAARETPPTFVAAHGEVARILEVPVAALLDPRSVVSTERHRMGVAMRVPAFQVSGAEIWGATAMVLAEFLALLGWQESPLA